MKKSGLPESFTLSKLPELRCFIEVVIFIILILLSAGGLTANAVESSKGDKVLIKKKDLPKNSEIRSISVSPDSKSVAVATKKSIYVIPLSKSGGLRKIYDKGSDIEEINYSNTGRFLSVMDGKKSGYFDFNRKSFIAPKINYFHAPTRFFFSDQDKYFLFSAVTEQLGYMIGLCDISDGRIIRTYSHFTPDDVRCLENQKILVALRNYKLSIFDIKVQDKTIYKEKIDCSEKKVPSFNGQKGYYSFCSPDIKHIIIIGDGTLLKRDLYGKEKPIVGQIEHRQFFPQLKEVRGSHVITIGGFKEVQDIKGHIRLYDYDKMQYISDEIPIEKVYDIAPSYKFMVYVWNGELRMRSMEKFLSGAK
jgi:WD40 repeat protein